MRILLALDGSAGAEVARDLVATLPWPAGSHVEAIRVVEPVVDAFAMAGVAYDGTIDDILGLDDVRRTLDLDVAPLATVGLEVGTHVLVGRAASAIPERARDIGAELIVMGSRGRGPIATMVLGSVSAEVSVHAPCPVLVARRPQVQRVIIALDGTPEADRIVDAVTTFTFLRDAHIDVVSVAPSAIPGPGVMLSGGYGLPVTWYEDSVAAARHSLEAAAEAAANRLRGAGFDAAWSIHEGDPAAALIETAGRTAADLIVIGTHARTGWTRLLLGSVARNVLVHAHASVLVLREPSSVPAHARGASD